MQSIGFRCTDSEVAFAVLDWREGRPTYLEGGILKLPARRLRGECLKWVISEIQALLDRYDPQVLYFKENEAVTSKQALERAQVEGALLIAAASHQNAYDVLSRRLNQIKRDVRLTRLTSAQIRESVEAEGISPPNPLTREAALVALCAKSML